MNRHTVPLAVAVAIIAGGVLVAAAPGFAGAPLKGTVSNPHGNANLVVYVVTAPGTFAPPAEHPVMNQQGMKFSPLILPVVLGTTVDFLNSDNLSHNVFSPDSEGYNLGTWPKGDRRSYTFKHLGTYTQLCSIHPEMEAFILVLQNPYYALTSADGHFTMADLPLGHYLLQVWGEKLTSKDKKRTFPVDVAAGGSTTSIVF